MSLCSSKRSTRRRFTTSMREFLNFINSCNLIDPPLEGVHFFTWSSHEEVPILSRIDRFLFSIDWDYHFQGLHQVILPKVTSDHFPILLQVGEVHSAKRTFNFEFGLRWMDFLTM